MLIIYCAYTSNMKCKFKVVYYYCIINQVISYWPSYRSLVSCIGHQENFHTYACVTEFAQIIVLWCEVQ